MHGVPHPYYGFVFLCRIRERLRDRFGDVSRPHKKQLQKAVKNRYEIIIDRNLHLGRVGVRK